MSIGEHAQIRGEETRDANSDAGAEIIPDHLHFDLGSGKECEKNGAEAREKLDQGVMSRPTVLPAIAPTMISFRGLDIATRIEMIDAASASASQTDDASQTLVISNSFRLEVQMQPPSQKMGTNGAGKSCFDQGTLLPSHSRKE